VFGTFEALRKWNEDAVEEEREKLDDEEEGTPQSVA
jgi:hypothetical protein